LVEQFVGDLEAIQKNWHTMFGKKISMKLLEKKIKKIDGLWGRVRQLQDEFNADKILDNEKDLMAAIAIIVNNADLSDEGEWNDVFDRIVDYISDFYPNLSYLQNFNITNNVLTGIKNRSVRQYDEFKVIEDKEIDGKSVSSMPQVLVIGDDVKET